MLSERIDIVELRALAAGNKRCQARVDSSNLESSFKRLARIVAGRDGSDGISTGLTIDLCFENGAEGYPCVHVDLDGKLGLECQRCLQPFGFPVKFESQLTILKSDAQLGGMADPFDCVVMTNDGLNLAAVIEDEILSALPIVPSHDSGVACIALDDSLNETKNDAENPHRPFANLASLMDVVGKDRVD